MILFALIRCWGRATASHSSAYRPCLDFKYHHCIACWEIARILGSVCSFPHIFHIYSKSTATPTYHRNFGFLCSSVVANPKICRGKSRNSSVVEFQGYFVLERPFLQLHEQRAKFANEINHLTRFFEKVDSQLPSRLMMLIRQPLKMKNGCELTKKSQIHHI